MSFRNGSYESSGFDNWMTPQHLIDDLRDEFGELYDPCPRNPTIDGLSIDWPTDRPCFVNPPYSEMAAWTAKCREQWERGCLVILLIPPRTDTRYFHANVAGRATVRFIKGRLKFVHPEKGEGKTAPFPSILCIYERVSA